MSAPDIKDIRWPFIYACFRRFCSAVFSFCTVCFSRALQGVCFLPELWYNKNQIIFCQVLSESGSAGRCKLERKLRAVVK